MTALDRVLKLLDIPPAEPDAGMQFVGATRT